MHGMTEIELQGRPTVNRHIYNLGTACEQQLDINLTRRGRPGPTTMPIRFGAVPVSSVYAYNT